MGNKFLELESALNMILNINVGKAIRLKELKKIENYACGLIHLTLGQRKLLEAVIEAFRLEAANDPVSEECLGGYNRLLKEALNINNGLRNPKCVVFGDNWLAEAVRNEMRGKHYCVFDWHTMHPEYLNEYDLFLLCDEPLKVYDLSSIGDKEKILKLWDYLKYKFVVFPSFYETYMNYKKQCGSKVKCIVTGNINVKSAVRSKLLHVKTVSLANSAQDIFYDFKMFCHAYDSLPDIEYAVIGLAPYSLRYDASKSRVEWRRCLVYYPIVETMHNCGDGEQLIALFESEDKKIRQYFDDQYMESLYDIYEKHMKSEDGEAAQIFDERSCTKESAALCQREISELYNRPFIDIMLENKVILEEYARFCKGKGIQVIFFIPPYTKWYIEHMQRCYYEELIAFLKELSAKYEAQLVDMLEAALPDCCFSDYANINDVGAVKTASYLNEIIDL